MSKYALLIIYFILVSCNNNSKISSQSMFGVMISDVYNKKDRKKIESRLDKINRECHQ